MLMPRKRTPLIHKIMLALVIITMIASVWTWAIVFHHFSDRTICLKVSIRDYALQQAPAKCQQMWKEGKL